MNVEAPLRLKLIGVSKSFPGVRANDNVNLTVRPGEIHALLGENGAGKSTLVKMIYGILAPDDGEIVFDGSSVRISNPRAARRLGLRVTRCGLGTGRQQRQHQERSAHPFRHRASSIRYSQIATLCSEPQAVNPDNSTDSSLEASAFDPNPRRRHRARRADRLANEMIPPFRKTSTATAALWTRGSAAGVRSSARQRRPAARITKDATHQTSTAGPSDSFAPMNGPWLCVKRPSSDPFHEGGCKKRHAPGPRRRGQANEGDH